MDQVRAAQSLRAQIAKYVSVHPMDLRREMDANLQGCRGDFTRAGVAAAMATARLLQCMSASLRMKKLDPGYIQLPGDTRLIAEALFFGFSVLSNDERDVHALGQIADVCVKKASQL